MARQLSFLLRFACSFLLVTGCMLAPCSFTFATSAYADESAESNSTDASSDNDSGSSSEVSSDNAASSDEGGASSAESKATEPDTSSENKVNSNQLPDSSFLYDVPISELTSADSFHDDQTVQVQGEVVGDLIADEADGSYCWVSLQETDAEVPAVVSVYMTRDLAKQIDSYGRYGQQGTVLQVMGTFHLACGDHQGLSDIHVSTASVVTSGKAVSYESSTIITTLAWLFPLVGIGLALYYRHRTEQER